MKELKIELVGLPIKKDNATALGMKIFEEVLTPLILKNNRAKFSKEFIEQTVDEYLDNPKIMKLISREYKVKPYNTYKILKGQTEPTGIYAQISKEYFDGRDGVINLIKNKKLGKVGKGDKYCTVEEALINGLKVKDLSMNKLWNELEVFIENKETLEIIEEEKSQHIKTKQATKIKKTSLVEKEADNNITKKVDVDNLSKKSKKKNDKNILNNKKELDKVSKTCYTCNEKTLDWD